MQLPLSGVANGAEYRVLGLRRSGNHAIISWIVRNFDGVVVHCNDIAPAASPGVPADPFAAYANIDLRGVSYWRYKKKLLGLAKYSLQRPEMISFVNQDPLVDKEALRRIPHRDVLVLSYENQDVAHVFSHAFEERRVALAGESHRRYAVLILRDPYNLFASMLRGGYMHDGNSREIVRLWKEHARSFLAGAVPEGPPCTMINYNRWCTDRTYRRNLHARLELPGTYFDHEQVPPTGGGSSFSGTRFDQRASQMKVLERWRHYANDEAFVGLFDDAELVALSNELFGAVLDAPLGARHAGEAAA